MRREESMCVDCALPCTPDCDYNGKVTILVCDECGCEVDELYKVDGQELCDLCALERLEKVVV